jgi:uncharacterized protein (DUF1499 family)
VLADVSLNSRKFVRRGIEDVKFLKSRTWSLLLAVAALAFIGAIVLLVIGAPRGMFGYRTAFDTLRNLAYVGIGGALLAAVTSVIARRGARALAAAATLMFAVPVLTMALNEATPPPGEFINDITTDLEDPPAFSAVIPLREPGSNPIEYGGAEVAAIQRIAHPEVQPIMTDLPPAAAFQRAFETAESLGWEIVAGDPRTGIIEAVDTTRFFRFKDDIVIRIRPNGAGSRVDLRSRSRVGRSDLGKNAARIVNYAGAFAAAS